MRLPSTLPDFIMAPVDIMLLAPRSLSITRGGLGLFVRDPAERARNADALFGLIADGTIKVEINQRYPLSETAQAHADLEGRRTSGSTVLTV